jgi:peptidyl-prolyl cis-trans isomerase D
MLDVLRASKGGPITWLFLAAIIVIFIVSFGPGSLVRDQGGCAGGASYAARVNGETVPMAEFLREYRPIAEAYERNPQGAAMLPFFAKRVVSQLVDQTLLSQEAERRGILISDDDLMDRLQQDPSFKVEGQFSKERYLKVVSRSFGSVDAFEQQLRREMRIDRLQGAVASSIEVPEAEIHDAWRTASDTLDVTYVLFPTADARTEEAVSDADAKAFAAREPGRVEKFYKENAARYDQPKKVRVRHILVKTDGKDDAAAKAKIEAAIARLEKGEDFAKVAAEVSEDVNTQKSGGDLGVITAGQVDPAFASAAMALEPGKISGPVKTPAGWHVIKVDEVIPGKKVSLEAARLDIARELLAGDRAAALVKEKAEAALKAVQAGKSLSDLYPEPRAAVAATEKVPASPEVKAALTWAGRPIAAHSTGSISAAVPQLPGLDGSADLLKDALAAQSGAVLPKVYSTTAGAVVAVVKSRARPDEAKYPAERRAQLLALQGQKARQLASVWLEELRAKARIVENPDPAGLGPQQAQQPQTEE